MRRKRVKVNGRGPEKSGGPPQQGKDRFRLIPARVRQSAIMRRACAYPAARTRGYIIKTQGQVPDTRSGLRNAAGKNFGNAVAYAACSGAALNDEQRTGVHTQCTNSPQKGLFLISSPMLVAGPCPGKTFVSSGREKSFSCMERKSAAWSPKGKSVRPMER